MGRKATPTHLKLVKGNPGRRAITKHEPKPRGNLTDPPDFLSAAQLVLWAHALECAPSGLLKRLDREALAIWVVACDLWRQALVAQALVDKDSKLPLLTKTPNGMAVQSPYVGIISKQSAIMLKAASELGFTPSSRTRISLEPEDDQDALEGILSA